MSTWIPCPGTSFANWETGYGDLHAVVDPQTVRALPWLPGSALVLCDLVHPLGRAGRGLPPRILRRQLERAAERGYEVKCATELEFYLFLDSFDRGGGQAVARPVPHTATVEDYQLLQTSREEYVIGRIRNEMVEAGLPVEFSKGEAGTGQHEINITYGDGLEVADRHLVFKTRGEGDRRRVRPRRHVHGEVVDGHGRVVLPPPREPVGRQQRRTAHGTG